eukprot:Tbor_TRINITY_DN5059_c0_g1::TRINITY_DN5059_c0_g1_i1::g.14042::m.14042
MVTVPLDKYAGCPNKDIESVFIKRTEDVRCPLEYCRIWKRIEEDSKAFLYNTLAGDDTSQINISSIGPGSIGYILMPCEGQSDDLLPCRTPIELVISTPDSQTGTATSAKFTSDSAFQCIVDLIKEKEDAAIMSVSRIVKTTQGDVCYILCHTNCSHIRGGDESDDEAYEQFKFGPPLRIYVEKASEPRFGHVSPLDRVLYENLCEVVNFSNDDNEDGSEDGPQINILQVYFFACLLWSEENRFTLRYDVYEDFREMENTESVGLKNRIRNDTMWRFISHSGMLLLALDAINCPTCAADEHSDVDEEAQYKVAILFRTFFKHICKCLKCDEKSEEKLFSSSDSKGALIPQIACSNAPDGKYRVSFRCYISPHVPWSQKHLFLPYYHILTDIAHESLKRIWPRGRKFMNSQNSRSVNAEMVLFGKTRGDSDDDNEIKSPMKTNSSDISYIFNRCRCYSCGKTLEVKTQQMACCNCSNGNSETAAPKSRGRGGHSLRQARGRGRAIAVETQDNDSFPRSCIICGDVKSYLSEEDPTCYPCMS